VSQIEGFLKFHLESLDRERLLAMGGAPFRVAVKQCGRLDFAAGRDDQLLGNKRFQGVHLLPPAFRGQAHRVRLGQTFGLPFEAAADSVPAVHEYVRSSMRYSRPIFLAVR
jgi:hypothetical protein